VIEGVSQVIVEVEDQDRALDFWAKKMEFELVQDVPYDEAGR
jgi:catechol 2,3-dioxygenase-like lactoylglutathione lyase family enzyme